MLLRIVAIILAVPVAGLVGVWIFGVRGRLMLPSTRAWLKEGGLRSVLNGKFFHGYVYGRWSNQYIGRGINHTFPKIEQPDGDPRWAVDYHGKVMPTELAKALLTIEEDIERRDIEQIIPYPHARDLVLNAAPDVALYECPCRHARPDPCLPTQVCMVVGQPFVDFIVEHNPNSSRRVSQQEALDLLQAEHDRGHVHVAYFKDVMLDRFYAICNCCACCCGGLEAMRRGVPMVTGSGYVAQVDEGLCIGCGTCEDMCPFDAVTVNGYSEVEWEKCMGCGVCVDFCDEEGIALVRDPRKGIPLDVRVI